MSTIKSFALLGFLPDAESKLKTLIQQHVKHGVSWVAATDSSLQGVIINADFISSPQIQKYIQRTDASIVCCFRDAEGRKEAEQLNIIGMDLDRHDRTALQHWLNHLVGEEVKLDSSFLTLLDNDSRADKTSEKEIKTNDTPSVAPKKLFDLSTPKADTDVTSESQPSETKKNSSLFNSSPSEMPASASVEIPQQTPKTGGISSSSADIATESTPPTDHSDLTLHDEYSMLLAKLQQNDGYYLIQYGDKRVWVDAKNNETYLDFERDQIPGIESARWAELQSLSDKGQARRLQLELWLFETLWQSGNIRDDKVSADGLYKLSRWPRPLCSHGRSEALRLAAFIQSAPATVSQLCTKTGYDDTMVTRFLNAAITAGQVKQTGTVAQQATPEQTAPKKIDNVKLGLIGRLRTRLGL